MPRRRFPVVTVAAIALCGGGWLGGLLEGGLLQLLLCLAALAIFGQGVEESLGRIAYAALLGACWLIALGAQLLTGEHAGVATLACAGAVAGAVGAYVGLHPGARVHSVLFAPLFSTLLAVPALVYVALWLALQMALGAGLDEPLASIGGAWFAHLATIAAGLAAARLLFRRRPVRPRAAS